MNATLIRAARTAYALAPRADHAAMADCTDPSDGGMLLRMLNTSGCKSDTRMGFRHGKSISAARFGHARKRSEALANLSFQAISLTECFFENKFRTCLISRTTPSRENQPISLVTSRQPTGKGRRIQHPSPIDGPGDSGGFSSIQCQTMKNIKYAVLLSAVLPIHAIAACTANTNDGRDYFIVTVTGFNPPPFSPGDIPIGGIIYEAKASGLSFTNSKDPWGPKTTCSPPFLTHVTGIGIPNAAKIYPTSVPNVGLRVVSPLGEIAPFTEPDILRDFVYWNIFYAPRIQLIKTGNVTESGVLSGPYANYRANNGAGQLLVEYRFAAPVLVTPKVPSCTVQTPRIQVPMGETMASTVFTGVGSTAPSRSFGIDLACSGGDAETTAKVYVTLTDATNPGNTSTTLSLSKDSTATGVGLQILKGDDVLGYGPASSAVGNTNQWLGGFVAQGASGLSIALRARYVQTSPRITSGTANAIANFTMSYQ